jgi:hypothetical protein
VLNTDALSAGDLFRIAAMARAGPSEPVVKEAEERAPAGAVATNALIKQLEDTDCHGVRMFYILPLVSSFFCAFV